MRPISLFIIDDDVTYVFLTKKTIKSAGLETTIKEFGDGKEAIGYIRTIYDKPDLLPDVIFLDLSMPVMDGWEFLKEYHEIAHLINKRIALYLVSSSISPYDIARARGIPEITEFIIKPLMKEKVIELMKDIKPA